MTSGFVSPKDNHRAKVVEVSTKDNTEVFEATVFFKSINKGNKPGWGQTDVLYRSERMELKNQKYFLDYMFNLEVVKAISFFVFRDEF